MKNFIILLSLLFFSCGFGYSQSKPKRDVSKDKSSIVARQQPKKRASSQHGKPRRRNAVRHRQTEVEYDTNQIATYLLVNQQTSVKQTFSCSGGSINFEVNTDGTDWYVEMLPSWCKIQKYGNGLVIFYEPNSSYGERQDYFKVKSGACEVKVDLTQSGMPINISGRFLTARLSHDTEQNLVKSIENTKWLQINTDVVLSGAKDLECLVVAFLLDKNNQPIKAAEGYSSFRLLSDGSLITVASVKPSTVYENENVMLIVPNDAMDLPEKTNDLKCLLKVYCVKTGTFIANAELTLNFRAKKKRNGHVTTKPYN